MDINEQTGYTGTNSNDILKFRDFNPINRGTMDAMDRIGQIRAKDLHDTTKEIIDPEDEEIETEEENDDLVINSKPKMGNKYSSHPFGFTGAPMAIGNSISTATRLMSEAHGVSDEIEAWVNLLYSFIKNQIFIFVDNVSDTDQYDTEAELNGRDFVSKSLVFNVEGKEFNQYIKEYIPKGEVKVKNLNIDLGISSIPDDLFSFDIWDAGFNDSDATIKNGVYLNTRLRFELFLPDSILKLENADDIEGFLEENGIAGKINEFLSHEIDHMHEYYRRKINQVDVWKDRLMNTNKFIVEQQLLSNVSDDWLEFLRLVYLSVDFEINARITQLYYALQETNPQTKYDFIEDVKDHSIWHEMMSLKEFDAETFYNNFTYKSSDEDLKSAFKSLNLYTDEEMEGADMKVILLKELITLWDKNIDETNKLYDSGEMAKISPYYINNPLIFFRKFENRFHKKAQRFEKRIYKLASKFNLD
ncbi:MAG: hypothetical protein SLAVMIC_00485 [uncultured marine phage]|uniref:Uncharacterized protein n=1 Tax=uncultured marine phage TaxID=707152 RepID=A0A8D9CA42_9VIRU|nr:MAG: hypothetical protein SLAVMIC_00485 [uncultured marine phage]